MPSKSRFSAPRASVAPSSKSYPMEVIHDMRGLDMTSPYDLIEKGRTPYAKNFRLYAEDEDSRRIAVSSRKGQGEYIPPFSETLNVANTSTTGAENQLIGVVLNNRSMPFTPSSTGRLTKLELNIRKNTGLGPITVSIHEDNAGLVGRQLAETTILGSEIGVSYAYVAATFIEAPLLTNGTQYHMFIHIQDDGQDGYQISSNTSSSLSKASNAGIPGLTATGYSLNYKTYLSPNYKDKGACRFAKPFGINKTLVAYETSMYVVDDVTKVYTAIATGLNANATNYYFTFGDGKVFWVNGYDDLRAWDGTTVEVITDPELPILKYVTMHKDRLWGVSAADPNKLVFSENPGNPSDAVDALHQWYYAWLSVSSVYVPAPKSSDAITGIVSFQDVLKVFTYTNKYDIYGTDRSLLTLRQSTGSKGAVSQNSIIADESFVYFAAQDGFYKHNGSSDELISDKVQSEFDGIAFPENITAAKWKRQIRFYYGASSSPYNTDCLLWHTTFEEWQHDTEVYVNRGVFFADGDDDRRLAEFSSLTPVIYNAEQDYNAMGKAIDFAYYMKYDSMKGPAQKKRILKYFPLIQGVDRSFVIDVDMDKDFANSPVHNQVILTSFGAVWGAFNWGDGTLWGGSSTFQPVKLRYPGYAYYWQMRISRKGANNPVFFFGVQYSYKPKRL